MGDEIAKYKAKSIDGWNHSVAFTLNTYKNNIQISEDGANRVQQIVLDVTLVLMRHYIQMQINIIVVKMMMGKMTVSVGRCKYVPHMELQEV